MEPIHSRDQQLFQFIGTKESFYIRKRFNVHMISLGHQHGLRFIVLVLPWRMWRYVKPRYSLCILLQRLPNTTA